MGLPISNQFEMTERMTVLNGGKTLQIEYIMTDPVNWKGEWHNTKRWIREDYSDVPEVECLPSLNANLPSTQSGTSPPRSRKRTASHLLRLLPGRRRWGPAGRALFSGSLKAGCAPVAGVAGQASSCAPGCLPSTPQWCSGDEARHASGQNTVQ